MLQPTVYVSCYDYFEDEGKEIIKHLNQSHKSFTIRDISNKEYKISVPVLCELVSENDFNLGIVLSKYGVYSSIMSNRYKDIRAFLCVNKEMTENAVKEYNINVLCIPLLLPNIKLNDCIGIIDIFLTTKFSSNFEYLYKNFMFQNL